MEAYLSAASGAVVARALERLAGQIPTMPGEEDPSFAAARRADALVALASGGRAGGGEASATVVVHARLDGLVNDSGGCEIERGPVIDPQVAKRLLCAGRVQTVVEDKAGQPLGVGRTSREPNAWMIR